MKRVITNNLKFFDVTMRDGLQSLKQVVPLEKKKELANFIYHTYRPAAMEIGSIVSSKHVPQMDNSIDVYKYCVDQKFNTELFMLTPNIYALNKAKEAGVKNFSFITSVSNDFQLKNTNKTIDETKDELSEMMKMLDSDDKVKVYISCINECPIAGKISSNEIAMELYYYIYNSFSIDQVCLSDTCGTLSLCSFNEIIKQLRGCINIKQVSLHLHKNTNNTDTPLIIEAASIFGITSFDVSAINNMGGCAMTIDSKKTLPPNLHYSDIDKDIDNDNDNDNDNFKKFIDSL